MIVEKMTHDLIISSTTCKPVYMSCTSCDFVHVITCTK